MQVYLQATPIIDWHHPAVLAQALTLAQGHSSPEAIAHACFIWVRDVIRHSVDYQMNPVTCTASDVLQHRTGYCYAKSHLLAALLRANNIPAGFCYQRLSVDAQGSPYCLHGLNAVYLPEWSWYRIDARGNKANVNAQFTPPHEKLALALPFPNEADFRTILPEPLPIVIEALQKANTWDEMLRQLPDISLETANSLELATQGELRPMALAGV